MAKPGRARLYVFRVYKDGATHHWTGWHTPAEARDKAREIAREHHRKVMVFQCVGDVEIKYTSGASGSRQRPQRCHAALGTEPAGFGAAGGETARDDVDRTDALRPQGS